MGRASGGGFDRVMGNRRGTDLPGGSADRIPPAQFLFWPTYKDEKTALVDLEQFTAYLCETELEQRLNWALTLFSRRREGDYPDWEEALSICEAKFYESDRWYARWCRTRDQFAEFTIDQAGKRGSPIEAQLVEGLGLIATSALSWKFTRHLLTDDQADEVMRVIPKLP